MEPLIRYDVIDKGFIELLEVMGHDMTPVDAARISHLGEADGSDKDVDLIHYLMAMEHTSPFEQIELRFRVKCPLFVRSQWHRHRTWNFNEMSGRYTRIPEEYYVPNGIRYAVEDDLQASSGSMEDLNRVNQMLMSMNDSCNHSVETYGALLMQWAPKEQARGVLPQAMYTQFYAKTDMHNLLHFLDLRTDSHAQYEIRVYADAIAKMIEEKFPIIYRAWRKRNAIRAIMKRVSYKLRKFDLTGIVDEDVIEDIADRVVSGLGNDGYQTMTPRNEE